MKPHMRITQRLHARIYFAVLASVLAVALLTAASWHLSGASESVTRGLDAAALIASSLLPAASAPRPVQEEAVSRWHREIGASLALFSPERELIAAAGQPLPRPEPGTLTHAITHPNTFGPAIILHLSDGRFLVLRHEHNTRRAHISFFSLLGFTGIAVGLIAYPVSRRLTRRLERLQSSVEALGEGNLSARVPIEGCDEVGQLASSFNRAAAQIEALVDAEKRLLANASHELRSPLARLRVAVGLLEGEESLKREIAQDVAELDALVDEILLASRFQAGAIDEAVETIDLTGLVAEECARTDAVLTGTLVTIRGRPRLVRRLVRNLLENGRRHSGCGQVDAILSVAGTKTVLDICDRGSGVPAEARERIFEPFYRLDASSTHPAIGGAGLGLALARGIARQHGGDIVCLPRDGGGTCFRVTLMMESEIGEVRQVILG